MEPIFGVTRNTTTAEGVPSSGQHVSRKDAAMEQRPTLHSCGAIASRPGEFNSRSRGGMPYRHRPRSSGPRRCNSFSHHSGAEHDLIYDALCPCRMLKPRITVALANWKKSHTDRVRARFQWPLDYERGAGEEKRASGPREAPGDNMHAEHQSAAAVAWGRPRRSLKDSRM